MSEILSELFEGRNIWGTYFLVGMIVCFINGYVRKIEADPLLGFTWIIAWPMTPLGNLVLLIVNIIRKIRHYQPIRRTKIFILRNF